MKSLNVLIMRKKKGRLLRNTVVRSLRALPIAIWIVILCIFFVQPVSARSFKADLTLGKMYFDGLERTCYLHLPTGHKSSGKLPVVLVLHGGGRGDGGSVGFFGKRRGEVVSTNETVRFWSKHNGCSSRFVRWVPDRDRRDHSRVRITTWKKPGNTCEVILYSIVGGGHTFPGSDVPNRPLLLGRKNNDINGAEVIWDFFSRHIR